MAYIYAIYNKETNKSYIGQTQHHPRLRFNKHLSQLRNHTHPNTYLQNSFDKYGQTAFNYIILAECDITSLDKLEYYYIKLFNTTNDDYGYNICVGGAGVISDIAQEKNKKTNQSKWSDVLKIDVDTLKVVQRYAGQNDAARAENISLSNIYKSCKDKGRVVRGYYYILADDYHQNWKPHINTKSQPYAIVSNNKIVELCDKKKGLSVLIRKGLPSINHIAANQLPFMYNNQKCYILPLTHEEYYQYNIGTCIDYPR